MPQAASYVFAPPSVVSVHVVGSSARFPVHRVYCVGRNYAEHAKEMGFSGREAPFFSSSRSTRCWRPSRARP